MNFEEYKKGLQDQYNIVSIEHAHWIKSNNSLNQERPTKLLGHPRRKHEDTRTGVQETT